MAKVTGTAKAKLTEDEILAYTLLGEAAGEGAEGLAAVMHVIKNRAESGRYPTSMQNVALEKNGGTYQFTTWSPKHGNNPTSRFSKTSEAFKEALLIVRAVKSGSVPDPTGGALNYYASSGGGGIKKPWWFDGEAAAGAVQIGNHKFAAKAAVDPKATANYGSQLRAAMAGTAYPATMSATTSQKRSSVNIDYLPANTNSLQLPGKKTGVTLSDEELDKLDAGAYISRQGGNGTFETAGPTVIVINRGGKEVQIPWGRYPPNAQEKRQAIADFLTKDAAQSGWGATPPAIKSVGGGLVTPKTASTEKQIVQDRVVNLTRTAADGSLVRNGGAAVSSANRGNVRAGAGQNPGADTARAGTPPPDGVYPGSDAYKRWEAQVVQSGGTPQYIPRTGPADRVNAVTETVRKDGTTVTSEKPGTVAMPAGARPSILPKLPVPGIRVPTGPTTTTAARGAAAAQSFTTKLVTKTVMVRNPAYISSFEKPQTAAGRAAVLGGAAVAGATAGKALTPTVPEFIEQKITVPVKTPVLQKPVVQTVPVAAPVAPVVRPVVKTVVQQYKESGLTSAQAYDQANIDARRRASESIGGSSSSGNSSGNLGGVSSSGRRYDYDNNTWV